MPTDPLTSSKRFLAANVRRLRTERDLTQDQLAEKAAIDPKYLQKIEGHAANPTLRVIVKIAVALDSSPASLLQSAQLQPRQKGRPAKS